MPSLVIRTIEVIGPYPGRIDFGSGMNVLVAPKDKGKTTVFRCINSVLGGRVLAETFKNEMAENEWIRGVVAVNGDVYTVYRGVRKLYDYVYISPGDISVEDPTALSKFMVAAHQGSDISYLEFLLNALGLPQFQYLKSLEVTAQDKDQFSFRSILRHIYVRADGYEGLVNKEYPHHRKMSFLMSTGTLDVDRAVGSLQYKDSYQRFTKLSAERSRIWSLVEHTASTFGVGIQGLEWAKATEVLSASLQQQLSDAEEQVAGLFRGPSNETSSQTVRLDPVRLVKLKARLDALLVHHREVEQEVSRLKELKDQITVRIEKKRRYAAGTEVFSKVRFIEKCTYCGHPLHDQSLTHSHSKIDVLKSISDDKEELAITAGLLRAKAGLLEDVSGDLARASAEYRELSRVFDLSLYSSAQSDMVEHVLERRASLRRAIQDVAGYRESLDRLVRDIAESEQFLSRYGSWDPVTKTASPLRWDDIIQPKPETKKDVILEMDALLNDFYSHLVEGFLNARMSDQFEPMFRQVGSNRERRTGGSTTDALIILGYFYALFRYSLIKGDDVPFPRLLMIDGLYGTWPITMGEALQVVRKFRDSLQQSEVTPYQLIMSFRQDDETDVLSCLTEMDGQGLCLHNLSERGFLTLSKS